MSEAAERVRNIADRIFEKMKERHFNNELGLVLEDFDEEFGSVPIASFIYEKKDNHLNNYDALHGGIIASIFDVAMGLGAGALSKSLVTTVDMSFSFLLPARGEKFRIIVEFGHVGKNVVSATCKMFIMGENPLEDDILCATGMGNYFILGIPLDKAGNVSKF